jgi:hypothetical protein
MTLEKVFYLTAKPRKYGQTTIPTMIFHQTRLAKAMVNNQPMNQKTPAAAAGGPPRLRSCAMFLSFQ